MKLSVAIADTHAADSAFVVWRGFERSIQKAKEYGYHGVELALRTAGEIDPAELLRLLERQGMQASGISTGQVFASLGQYLTNPDEAERLAAVETIRGLAELAGDFGGIVNIGRARGFYPPGAERPAVRALFVDSLLRVADAAAKRGVTVVIEPVNRYEINFINSVEECARLLREVDCENIGIMPDVFHMNIEDARIGESLIGHAALIRYIHLADSNRRAPGSGHLDFDEIFGALLCMRYDGWVSVEILPEPGPDEAARQAAQYLLPRIERHNILLQERAVAAWA